MVNVDAQRTWSRTVVVVVVVARRSPSPDGRRWRRSRGRTCTSRGRRIRHRCCEVDFRWLSPPTVPGRPKVDEILQEPCRNPRCRTRSRDRHDHPVVRVQVHVAAHAAKQTQLHVSHMPSGTHECGATAYAAHSTASSASRHKLPKRSPSPSSAASSHPRRRTRRQHLRRSWHR